MMWYSVNNSDILYECRSWKLSASEDFDLELCANKAAEDFFNNHNGWECSWPIEISLYASKNCPRTAKLIVTCEAEPVFYSRIMK